MMSEKQLNDPKYHETTMQRLERERAEGMNNRKFIIDGNYRVWSGEQRRKERIEMALYILSVPAILYGVYWLYVGAWVIGK